MPLVNGPNSLFSTDGSNIAPFVRADGRGGADPSILNGALRIPLNDNGWFVAKSVSTFAAPDSGAQPDLIFRVEMEASPPPGTLLYLGGETDTGLVPGMRFVGDGANGLRAGTASKAADPLALVGWNADSNFADPTGRRWWQLRVTPTSVVFEMSTSPTFASGVTTVGTIARSAFTGIASWGSLRCWIACAGASGNNIDVLTVGEPNVPTADTLRFAGGVVPWAPDPGPTSGQPYEFQIEAWDSVLGERDTAATGSVTLTVSVVQTPATIISGTLTQPLVNGVASFTDIVFGEQSSGGPNPPITPPDYTPPTPQPPPNYSPVPPTAPSFPPTVTAVEPTTAPPGRRVRVSGSRLFGVTGFTVNGAPAVIEDRTDTSFFFIVPQGATSGPLVVQHSGGNSAAGTFTVEAVAPPPTFNTNNMNTIAAVSRTTTGTVNGSNFSLPDAAGRETDLPFEHAIVVHRNGGGAATFSVQLRGGMDRNRMVNLGAAITAAGVTRVPHVRFIAADVTVSGTVTGTIDVTVDVNRTVRPA